MLVYDYQYYYVICSRLVHIQKVYTNASSCGTPNAFEFVGERKCNTETSSFYSPRRWWWRHQHQEEAPG